MLLKLCGGSLRIFESNRLIHGNMGTGAALFKEELNSAQRRQIVSGNKDKLGKQIGFDYRKMFINIQKNSKSKDRYPDGHHIELTQENTSTVEDLFDLDLYCDIVVVHKSVTGIATGYNVADCPVVIAVDEKQGIFSLSHCGGEYIDRYLHTQTIDTLTASYGSNEQNIKVYIGSHIAPESYDYNGIPRWVTDEKAWEKYIKEINDNELLVDIRNRLINDLLDRRINRENILVNLTDTAIDPEKYSNNSAHKKIKEAGLHFQGALWIPEK